MRLYFVRHGESESNIREVYQGPDVKLSPAGIKQAQILAKRFKKIPIDLILSSHHKRAKHTAEIIAKKLIKPIEYTNLLAEVKPPSAFIGRNENEPEIAEIRHIIREKHHNPDWRYSDEENFFDYKKRATEFLDFVKRFKGKQVLVVTHGGIMRIIVLTMFLGDKFIPGLLERGFLYIHNTGITVCEYDGERWRLITWNDHAHLG